MKTVLLIVLVALLVSLAGYTSFTVLIRQKSSDPNRFNEKSEYAIDMDTTGNRVDQDTLIHQAKLVDGIDVLDYLRKANGVNRTQPPSKFKPGHVSESLVIVELTETKDGFIIDLPGDNNVPTPGIYKGVIYVSGGFGSKEYFAFEARTGEEKWSITLDDDGPSSPAIEDGVIVFNTESCTIFALDAETGEHLWSWYLGDPLMSMPTVANGKVFTSYPYQRDQDADEVKENGETVYDMAYTHVLAAFDLRSGKVLWQKWIDGDVMSAPVADGENLFVTTFPGTVYKFDQNDGSILSARYMRATSAPVVSDEEMIVSRRFIQDDKVMENITQTNTSEMEVTQQYAEKQADYLDKRVQSRSKLKAASDSDDAGNGFTSGAPLSSAADVALDNIGQGNVSSLQSFQGSRILKYKSYNINTMGDEVICSDSRTGKEKWKTKLDGDMNTEGGYLGTPPLMAGGKIIIATLSGKINILNIESGHIERTWSTGESIRYQPVVDEGWIYVTTTNGKMIAINTHN